MPDSRLHCGLWYTDRPGCRPCDWNYLKPGNASIQYPFYDLTFYNLTLYRRRFLPTAARRRIRLWKQQFLATTGLRL